MIDVRKWIPALAAALLAGGVANAQSVACSASAGSSIVRAEGLTELLGDISLQCTGGATGTPAATFTIQVTLNTDFTSALVSDPATDAAIIVTQGGVVSTVQGRRAANTQVSFVNVQVPLLAPNAVAVIRIANIRGNAAGIGAGAAIIASVSATTSAGGVSLTLSQSTFTIGTPALSLASRVRTAANDDTKAFTGLQCSDLNRDLAADASRTGQTTSLNLQFREQQQYAFKTALEEQGSLQGAGLGASTNGTRLRAVFNGIPTGVSVFVTTRDIQVGTTDAGFTAASIATGGAPVASAASRAVLVTADASGAGGTAPAVPPAPASTDQGPIGSGGSTVNLFPGPLPAISGVTAAAYPGNFNLQQLTINGGSGTAVWEIIQDNPNKSEDISFAVVLAWRGGQPVQGTATVNMSLAPTSTNRTSTAPGPPPVGATIPRFTDTSSANTAFVVNPCATNLLFTYATSLGGFDTGLSISNTSSDPFGTAAQSGECTMTYYGYVQGGAPVPAPVTTPPIPAGKQLVWTLSSGGNISGGPTITGLATPGFQGYIIAQCRFRFAHGFAFVSDQGARTIAMGYIPLVMDASGANRDTKTTGESFTQ